ncbi:hypothetical protein Hbl1158_05610 [Halobaculum sp. CBA1158]|uniref:DUF7322 domain-containing protein n=1 Tax=Halobaculum sp. CBA1158 TaxID=2904243 RepID=UPI001F2DC9B0|nr:hypothetical protein [Halobaculum sp. CBA1158]UIP00833.1 hypothetical protein Hbl1158_05610 [Halobaculum sp. CBA1158]
MLGDDEDGELFDLERQASGAEERGPRVTVPSVDNPADSLPDPESVDPEIQRHFVAAVLYANVALFGVSLGPMLIWFRGDWRWGGIATAVGVLAGIRVYQTVRAFERRDSFGDADGSESAEDAGRDIDGVGDADDPTEAERDADDDAAIDAHPDGDASETGGDVRAGED